MYYSLYLIDKSNRRIGKEVGSGLEPYILYSNDVVELKSFLDKVDLPHQCSKIDGGFYTLDDVDISIIRKTDSIVKKFRCSDNLPKELYV